MAEGMKHKLVGLAAIVIAALVFFPLVFDGEGYRERQLASKIPAEPDKPSLVHIEPVNPRLPDTSELGAVTEPRQLQQPNETLAKVMEAQPDRPKPASDYRKDTPRLDDQAVPVAWTLQLASFKAEANARTLRKKLVAAGHKVYTRKQGDLIKVYVGPDIQRTNLEKLQSNLKENFGLNGMIVRFTTQ